MRVDLHNIARVATAPSSPPGPGKHSVYHATAEYVKRITRFRNPEIGFHFAANSKLAINAAIKGGKHNPKVFAFEITLRKPEEITGEPNSFTGFRVLEDLLDRGIITEDEFNPAMDRYEEMEGEFYEDELKEETAKLIQELMKPKGIDGFVYWNEFDAGFNILGTGLDVAPDWSFIVFDNSQIRLLGEEEA